MTYRPGINLLRGAGGLLAAAPLAFWWPAAAGVLVAATAALGLAALFDARRLRPMLDELAVVRHAPLVVPRDARFDVRLTVANRGARPVRGELRDEAPAEARPPLTIVPLILDPGASFVATTTYRLPRRGRRQFGPVWVQVAGPLRLMEASRAIACPGEVKVLPETFASRERLEKDAGAEQRLLDQLQKSRQYGVGAEFESLYPFRPGDDPRRIDWRATARRRELVVRRFQIERHRDVMIVIDCGRLMGAQTGRGTKLDCAVDAALNLARVVLHSGDRCGAAAYDRQVRGFLPPIAGAGALGSIIHCVYDLETQWHESDFTPMLAELRARRAKRTLLVVISDVNDAETSRRLSASLYRLRRQHVVLFAALRTPLLADVVKEPVLRLDDAARKVVAFRLLRDRGRALHALRRGGVHVLDVEPQQLSTPLINQFIELRQRNLL